MNQEAPIFSLWLTILDWLFDRVDGFPKKVRLTLSNRLLNLALDILELIIEALYNKKKAFRLRILNINIEKLRVLLRICLNKKYLSLKQYEFIQEKLTEAGSMVGGWLKSREENG